MPRTPCFGVLLLFAATPALGAAFQPWSAPPARPVLPIADVQKDLVCEAAIDIGADETLCGDTTGLVSNVDFYSCSAWPQTGGEIVYRLTLTEPTMFAARLDAECDLDLALLGGCAGQDECFLVADTGIKTDAPVSGIFYLVVDGYNGAACSFCLTVGPPGIVAAGEETWSVVKGRFDAEGRMP